VGNDVDRREVIPTLERHRDLPRRRSSRVEHDRINARPQSAQDNAKIRNCGINEQDFAGLGHVAS
jgi:hypothetical protein